MIDFLLDALAAGIGMLIIAAIFAALGSGRSFGGGTTYSFGQMLFSVIFAFVAVVLISALFARTYFPAAQVFGTVVITPVLAIVFSLVWVYLRARFGKST